MAQKEEAAAAAEPAGAASQNGEDLEDLEDPEKLKELIELPPFEIVTGAWLFQPVGNPENLICPLCSFWKTKKPIEKPGKPSF